jgi:type I restriction enzyme M protein
MPLPADFEKRLWAAADQLWANTGLYPSEYAAPVLALLFLRHADARSGQGRFERLLSLPPGRGLGKAVSLAVESALAEMKGASGFLRGAYECFDPQTLRRLLDLFGEIPEGVDGDVLGRVYEYFLGRLAPAALQKGGEFYTPSSVVRLIVEILEPFHGKILDPACGSGGMFIQSSKLVLAHGKRGSRVSIHGIEKAPPTLALARMNLAVHGLAGELALANVYYDAKAHRGSWGKFDFVAANPPFNQAAVDKGRLADPKRRFPFGIPTKDNANYLWIQLFYSALCDTGRAGFVMANTASDARGSELAIRKKLLETGAVDVILALGPSLFYTVTLPVMLWFLDRGKTRTKRRDRVLFIDARSIFRQVDRAHRDLAPEQIERLASLVRAHRGRGKYEDVAGLCKSASLGEIEARGWSLHPGRYVGAPETREPDYDFRERLLELNRELARLGREARKLEARIAVRVAARGGG